MSEFVKRKEKTLSFSDFTELAKRKILSFNPRSTGRRALDAAKELNGVNPIEFRALQRPPYTYMCMCVFLFGINLIIVASGTVARVVALEQIRIRKRLHQPCITLESGDRTKKNIV